MSYRQLTPEEEKLDEGVTASWETFLFHIQEAVDFVNTQTPLITQNLESTYDVSIIVKYGYTYMIFILFYILVLT